MASSPDKDAQVQKGSKQVGSRKMAAGPDISKLLEKARQCVERRNYDYAIDLYIQALTINPGHLEARQALRAVERRRLNEGAGGNLFNKVTGVIMQFAIPNKGDPDKRALKCEGLLKNNPNNKRVLKALANALIDGGDGCAPAAVWVLEDLRNLYVADKNIAKMLGDYYELTNNVKKALEVYQQLAKLDPTDRLVGGKVNDLHAMSMADVFQKGADEGARAIVKDQEVQARSDRKETLRTEEDVLDEIKFVQNDVLERPEDANLRVKVGDLYMRLKDWDNAGKYFEQARELSPTEHRIKFKLDDVEISRMNETCGQESDRAKKKKIYNEYMRYRLKSFEEREQAYITDLQIAYDLGQLYYTFKKYDEAIKRFQKTVKDPKNRAVSAWRLGQSFQKKGQFDLAVRQLSDGINSMEVMTDMKKELLYTRGKVYEEDSKMDEAKQDFMTIYEIDIDFKDVQKKIEV